MKPHLVLTNFGYKKYMTEAKPFPKADLYIDCRGLVDGALSDTVKVANGTLLFAMKTQIEEAVHTLKTRWPNEPNRPFVVAFFCAHGMHRSVAAKMLMAESIDYSLFDEVEVR